MRVQFDHLLKASFGLYFEHMLLNTGQAYYNVSGALYKIADSKLASLDTYASPFRQWVADNSVSGATIASGIDTATGFIGRNASTIIDYQKGRVIKTKNTAPANVSGAFAIKDFNLYISSEADEEILFDKTLVRIPRWPEQAATTGLSPDVRPFPCIYINYSPGHNEEWCFGGVVNTQPSFRAIVIADSDYLLDGCFSIFRDCFDKIFPIIPASLLPYTEYGDLKSGSYNYAILAADRLVARPDAIGFIKRVDTSKFENKINKEVNNEAYCGIIDFDIEIARMKHQVY